MRNANFQAGPVPAPRGLGWLAQPGTAVQLLSERDLLYRAATFVTLALPITLMYGRTLGEIAIALVGIAFLLQSWGQRRWNWVTDRWAALGLLFWAWLLLCSLREGYPHAIAEAFVMVRFVLLVVALEQWVLRDRRTRRYLGSIAIVLALWIAIECWQQYLFGSNIFGVRSVPGTALSGPWLRPRAGTTLQQLFLLGVLPVVLLLLLDVRLTRRIIGAAVLLLGLITSFLIRQDMPALLLMFGLCIAGLTVRQFRLPLLLCLGGGAAFLAAGVVVSPSMYQRLVLRFVQLIQHFPVSPYGLLYNRALAMIQAHPWAGLGFDGFRIHCMDPQFLRGSSWLPPPDTSLGLRYGWLMTDNASDLVGCSIHPHNYWMQVGSSAGLPGVLLFTALAVTTLWRAGRGLPRRRNMYQVSLFAAAAVIFWPLQSATDLFGMPNGGWLFLTLGWAMAEGDAAGEAMAASPARPAGASQDARPVGHEALVGSNAPSHGESGGA